MDGSIRLWGSDPQSSEVEGDAWIDSDRRGGGGDIRGAPFSRSGADRAGQSDTATLSASGKKALARANITHVGSRVAPDLTLSPGTFEETGPLGKEYRYDFGGVREGQTLAQTFTVTNGGSGATDSLQLTFPDQDGFSLGNDMCSGRALAPSETCTFNVIWTTPAECEVGYTPPTASLLT
jgi:hypothetical protein